MSRQAAARRGATFLAFICLTWAVPAPAQVEHRMGLPLRINEGYEQAVRYQITFDPGASEPAYGLPAGTGHALGSAPGGVLVRVERVSGQPAAYRIRVDSDGDGDVAEEAAQVATPNSSVMVKVGRSWAGGKRRRLPYLITYSRDTDRSNQLREVFWWRPHYRAEGGIRVNTCETLFAVLDLNGDGLFDRADFSAGSSVSLDRNGDGQIWGAGEWLRGEEIIEFCGDSFLVEGLEADGSLITLAKTALRVPKVGEPVPAYSLTTVEGASIRSDELKGKVHLLDFWATWCQQCIEKFPLVKRLGEEFKGDLTIIAVNVDDASRLPMARQVIKDYRLPWPQVMRGEGERDHLWKMFGGMGNNQLNIPLYVLVDEQGVLRYAGRGGADLSELRSSIRELIRAK